MCWIFYGHLWVLLATMRQLFFLAWLPVHKWFASIKASSRLNDHLLPSDYQPEPTHFGWSWVFGWFVICCWFSSEHSGRVHLRVVLFAGKEVWWTRCGYSSINYLEGEFFFIHWITTEFPWAHLSVNPHTCCWVRVRRTTRKGYVVQMHLVITKRSLNSSVLNLPWTGLRCSIIWQGDVEVKI